MLALRIIIGLLFTTLALATQAGTDSNRSITSLDYAQVDKVLATKQAEGTWCFAATVKHNDLGRDHYADGWEVTDLQGNQLAFRKLAHPHVNEQPFTRSLCNIQIPTTLTQVIVKAKCNKHGYGDKTFIVDL